MISFSEDQATALVTDPGTLKRGQELVNPAKWGNLGRTDTAAWGECAGSGSKPYLTGIDLTEPAFKCSCPSRVFPCKHGAGLLLLLARQPALLPDGTPPAWLADWLSKRQAKDEAQAEKVAAKIPKKAASPVPGEADAADAPAPSPAAPTKRDAQRLARRQAGAEDLATWLLDLLRAGVADLAGKPGSFWESQAARLVDNQLPGLAALLRELADYPTAGPYWAANLLGRLGEVYLLVRAFLNRESLPAAARQEITQQVGTAPKKDELLADPTTLIIADTWRVLGQHTWAEERLTARRSWLHGQHSGRTALVLEFSFGGQPFATPLLVQSTYAGELAFYPGLLPLRAVPVVLTRQPNPTSERPPLHGVGALLEAYAAALASQPWLREWPASIRAVVTRSAAGAWAAYDADLGAALPLRLPTDARGWHLLALSGGRPLALFGEWDGRAFRVLSSWQPAATQVDDPLPAASPDVLMSATSAENESPTPPAPPATNPWPTVLRIALLGTRQCADPVPEFGLREPLPADSREQQLLLTAGALALVRKAGFLPLASPAPAAAPAETGQPLGAQGRALLKQLVASPHLRTYLLRNYLRQLAERSQLVPPALLAEVLDWLHTEKIADPLLARALGERGRWLAAQNPDWQLRLAAGPEGGPAETDWHTGTLPQRRLFLENVLRTDPARAARLLAETLPQEPAATQTALLGALEALPPAAPLPAEFGPVLGPLLASRAKEARQTAARWLARTADSPLLPRLWARAEPLLHLKRKILGSNTLEITLPTWAADWQREGIEQKNNDYPGGEKAGQLGQLLALLPPSRWAAAWGVSPTQAVALAAASDWANVLLPAWLRAARLHHEADFAHALLLHETQRPSMPPHSPLLAEAAGVLTTTQKTTWLLAALPAQATALPASSAWTTWLALADLPWPAPLRQRALPLLRAALRQPAAWTTEQTGRDQAVRGVLLALSASDEPTLLPLLTAELGDLAEIQPRFTEEVNQLLQLLALRPQLAASLAEPA
jgi:hypothetical protein